MEQHFDINQIIGIKIVKPRKSSYVWREAKPAYTRFFGLFRYPAKPEGWEDMSSWDEKIISTEKLINYGYIMLWDEGNPDPHVRVPHHRPHVTVYLAHEYQVNRQFETLEEATQWANHLETASQKEFEIVKY